MLIKWLLEGHGGQILLPLDRSRTGWTLFMHIPQDKKKEKRGEFFSVHDEIAFKHL